MAVAQDFFKNFFFFLRRVGLVDTGGRQPSRHFLVVGRPILWEMQILHMSLATLSSLRARRTPKTVVKCEFCTCQSRHFVLVGRPKLWRNAKFSGSSRNLIVVSCSSDIQNCGEMQILTSTAQPSRHFVLARRPKLW